MRTVLLLLVFASGCVGTRYLPRRTTPERTLPPVVQSVGVSGPGTAPIVIDVVDGPTRVERLLGYTTHRGSYDTTSYSTRYQGGRYVTYAQTTTHFYQYQRRQTGLVCPSTPCVAHLPAGDHTLIFAGPTTESEVDLRLAGRPLALRHALRLRVEGTNMWPTTLLFWAVGALAAGLGPAIALYDDSSLGQEREPIGWGIAAAGIGTILIGALLLAGNRDHVVTPGSILAWDL